MFKNAFSILEIMIVVSIMALFSSIALFSFSNVKDEVLLSASIELLETLIQQQETAVFSELVLSSELVFSLSHPQLFFIHKDFYTPKYQENLLAKNLEMTSIAQADDVLNGNVDIAWTNAQNGASTAIDVETGARVLLSQNNNDTALSITKINEDVVYTVHMYNSNKDIESESLTLMYYSPVNLQVGNNNSVELQKIEVLTFANTWVPVNDCSLKFVSGEQQKQYFSGSKSYQSTRLTFNRNGEIFIYEL